MAAWTVGTMLAGASALSAQETRGALTVTVHVTDYAALSAADLADAQAQATAVYRAAGLDIIWSSAAWKPEARHVRLVILSRDMTEKKCREERLGDGVMGSANSGASIAYVFYDRIERIAVSRRIPVVRGLGHVMAHEMGHLLIGVNSHSEEGLMQANWDPREGSAQTFTTSQVQQIRRRLMATLG